MPIALLQHILKQSFNPGSAEYVKPTEYVARLVQGFWVLPDKNLNLKCIAFSDGIPTICLFTDSEGYIDVLQNDQVERIHAAWLSSQYLLNIQLSTFSNSGHLLVARFNPMRFYQSFDIEPRQLREKSIWTLEETMGRTGDLLVESLKTSATIEGKIKAFEAVIAEYVSESDTNYLIELAITTIVKEKGCTSVAALLKQLKVNYKWLERNFTNYLGLSPKEYIRLQRFLHAYSYFCDNPDHNLLQIAVENGYYDHSHLIKDFKTFIGHPPSYFI